eukprot:755390-Amphidinium_carterae.2
MGGESGSACSMQADDANESVGAAPAPVCCNELPHCTTVIASKYFSWSWLRLLCLQTFVEEALA